MTQGQCPGPEETQPWMSIRIIFKRKWNNTCKWWKLMTCFFSRLPLIWKQNPCTFYSNPKLKVVTLASLPRGWEKGSFFFDLITELVQRKESLEVQCRCCRGLVELLESCHGTWVCCMKIWCLQSLPNHHHRILMVKSSVSSSVQCSTAWAQLYYR